MSEADKLLKDKDYELDLKTEEKEWYINKKDSSGIIFYLKTKEYTVYYDDEILPVATNKIISMKLHRIINRSEEHTSELQSRE